MPEGAQQNGRQGGVEKQYIYEEGPNREGAGKFEQAHKQRKSREYKKKTIAFCITPSNYLEKVNNSIALFAVVVSHTVTNLRLHCKELGESAVIQRDDRPRQAFENNCAV